MQQHTRERIRRSIALWIVLVGWLGSLALGIWSVVEYEPAKGRFAPEWVALGYIFLIGVAIAASTARSRMRMTDTIIDALRVGQEVADDRWRKAAKQSRDLQRAISDGSDSA